jgi:hypothetical protein
VSTPVPQNTQEPPFYQPFIDTKTGVITETWRLWLINLFDSQNMQNSGITTNASAAAAAQSAANAAQAAIPVTVAQETARAEAAEAALGTQVTAETARAEAAEALLAPINNPAFTGIAAAPEFSVTGPTAATATGGAATLPGNPVGFLVFAQGKVPYYAT